MQDVLCQFLVVLIDRYEYYLRLGHLLYLHPANVLLKMSHCDKVALITNR